MFVVVILSHFAFLHLSSSDFHVVFAPFRLTISLRYRAELLSPSGYDPPCLFPYTLNTCKFLQMRHVRTVGVSNNNQTKKSLAIVHLCT